MKAMIFAAGLGTRLKPLTDTIPKALVPLEGRPLLDWVINRLIAAGFDEIVVNVHHFGQQVIDYLDWHPYNVAVTISDERKQLLDTGGGLLKAAPLFSADSSPSLIHNVDILHNADLPTFYVAGLKYSATLLVSERSTSRYLLFDESNRLVGWTNIITGEVRSPYADLNLSCLHKYAFSGIHTFSPHLFSLMKGYQPKFSIIDFYLSVCDKVDIMGYPVNNLQLVDVGKLDSLKKAETFLKTGSLL